MKKRLLIFTEDDVDLMRKYLEEHDRLTKEEKDL
jgi:hypothetical protein